MIVQSIRLALASVCAALVFKQPAEVSKVVLDEEEHRVEVVVADEQFPLAIGRRGQNVRLASQLTGWQIDLVTESDDSERYQIDFQRRTDLFMSEGFEAVEDIAYIAAEDFMQIEGFDEEVAEEIQERAREYLEKLAEKQNAKRVELGVEDAVMELDGMSPGFAVKLGENEVKSVEDVAGLVPDDLTGWRENNKEGKPVWQDGILKKGEMRKDDAQIFIMKARVIAGWIEPEALEQLEAEMAAEAAGAEEELTEEERALLALGELGKTDTAATASDDGLDVTDEDILAELEGLDLDEDLLMEGGDDAAEPQ